MCVLLRAVGDLHGAVLKPTSFPGLAWQSGMRDSASSGASPATAGSSRRIVINLFDDDVRSRLCRGPARRLKNFYLDDQVSVQRGRGTESWIYPLATLASSVVKVYEQIDTRSLVTAMELDHGDRVLAWSIARRWLPLPSGSLLVECRMFAAHRSRVAPERAATGHRPVVYPSGSVTIRNHRWIVREDHFQGRVRTQVVHAPPPITVISVFFG